MKYIQFTLCYLLFSFLARGQSLEQWAVGSEGGYTEAGPVSLSYTLGEVAVETEDSPSLTLTQGFQQGKLNAIGIEVPEWDLSVKAYPNPTSTEVVLEISSPENLDLDIRIMNARGQIVGREEVGNSIDHKQVLDFSSFAAGVYFIQLSNGGDQFKNIKIIKEN